jgi:hypothetical protein
MTHGIYDADGKIRCTASPGGGWVGAYAPDGSWYVTIVSPSSWVGLRASDGSLNIVNATGSTDIGVYDPSGALRVTTGSDLNGAYKVSGITFAPPGVGNPIGLLLALTYSA